MGVVFIPVDVVSPVIVVIVFVVGVLVVLVGLGGGTVRVGVLVVIVVDDNGVDVLSLDVAPGVVGNAVTLTYTVVFSDINTIVRVFRPW